MRHQDWTTFVIELAIVVLGVFVGMQVSNWNQARVEQERTDLVLDAFRADMRDYLRVQQTFGDKITKGLAAFDAARAKGEKPAPFFLRFRGSDTAPKSVWQVAEQSGLAELVHPSLMFDIGYYYSEIDGIGVKFVRYAEFVEKEVLPRLGNTAAFYEASGELKPEFQQNMQRLREWVDDSAVTTVSAKCLLTRFEKPTDPGPSCRPDYGDFNDPGSKP
jgi:hypothetical protein